MKEVVATRWGTKDKALGHPLELAQTELEKIRPTSVRLVNMRRSMRTLRAYSPVASGRRDFLAARRGGVGLVARFAGEDDAGPHAAADAGGVGCFEAVDAWDEISQRAKRRKRSATYPRPSRRILRRTRSSTKCRGWRDGVSIRVR